MPTVRSTRGEFVTRGMDILGGNIAGLSRDIVRRQHYLQDQERRRQNELEDAESQRRDAVQRFQAEMAAQGRIDAAAHPEIYGNPYLAGMGPQPAKYETKSTDFTPRPVLPEVVPGLENLPAGAYPAGTGTQQDRIRAMQEQAKWDATAAAPRLQIKAPVPGMLDPIYAQRQEDRERDAFAQGSRITSRAPAPVVPGMVAAAVEQHFPGNQWPFEQRPAAPPDPDPGGLKTRALDLREQELAEKVAARKAKGRQFWANWRRGQSGKNPAELAERVQEEFQDRVRQMFKLAHTSSMQLEPPGEEALTAFAGSPLVQGMRREYVVSNKGGESFDLLKRDQAARWFASQGAGKGRESFSVSGPKEQATKALNNTRGDAQFEDTKARYSQSDEDGRKAIFRQRVMDLMRDGGMTKREAFEQARSDLAGL